MFRSARLDGFRMHRHRAARRRRCPRVARPLLESTDALRVALPGEWCAGARPLWAALPFLARRMAPYRSVRGLLYRLDGASVDLHIVAPAPMTAAVSLLASRWVAQLKDLFPALAWNLRVAPDRPVEGLSYRCVYWRSR